MKKLIYAFVVLSGLFLNHAALAAADDEAYFRQFLYRREDENNDPDFPPKYRYYILVSSIPFDVPLASGETLKAWFDIKLNGDGTFEQVYRDYLLPVGHRPDDPYGERQCVKSAGTWSVPGTELEMRDSGGKLIFIGARDFVQGRNAIRFSFTDAFLAQELHGVSHAFVMAQGDTEPWMRCFPF